MPLETFAAQPPAPPAPVARPEVTIGSLISHTLAVWWKNMFWFAAFTLVVFVPIIVAAAVVLGLNALLAIASGSQEAVGQLAARMVLVLAVVVPLALIAGAVQMGGLTYGAVQHMARRPVRLGGMFAAGLGRVLPLIGLALLVGVAFMGTWLVIVLLGQFLGGFVTILLAIALVVVAVIVLCGLTASVPAVVAERIGPIDAMNRSWGLTSGRRGSIFVALLVLFIIQFVIGLVAGAFGRIPFLGVIISLAVQLLAGSITTVMPAVAYHDLRTMKEGASTDDLARVFE